MAEYTLSIGIITYKHEKYIRQCLDSVFNQVTNFDYEVIVGEDCSPDNTRKILMEYKKKYGEKLKLILQDKNLGASRNSFYVHKLCKGKYITLLEGDDYWTDSHRIQKLVTFLEENQKYIAVAHNHIYVDENNNYVGSFINTRKTYNFRHYLKYGYSIHVNTLMYRNILPVEGEKFEKLRFSVPTMGDVIKFCLLYDKGEIFLINDFMLAHRIPSKSDTSSFSYRQKNEALYFTKMYQKLVEELEIYYDYKYNLKPLLANRISNIMISSLVGTINLDKKEFRQYMKQFPFKFRLICLYKFFRNLIRKIFRKIRMILYGKK